MLREAVDRLDEFEAAAEERVEGLLLRLAVEFVRDWVARDWEAFEREFDEYWGVLERAA